MTNEKLYGLLEQLITEHSASYSNDGGDLAKFIHRRADEYESGTAKYDSKLVIPELTLAYILAEVRAEIKTAEAKKSGTGDALKAAKAILKDSAKRYADGRFTLPIMQNGKQYITNGYMAVCHSEKLDIPSVEKPDIDMERVFNANAGGEKTPLELPGLAGLKAYIKLRKASKQYDTLDKSIIYDFGGETWGGYNAEMLAVIMDSVPDGKAEYCTKTKALYLANEKSAAILLPIKIKDATERKKTVLK